MLGLGSSPRTPHDTRIPAFWNTGPGLWTSNGWVLWLNADISGKSWGCGERVHNLFDFSHTEFGRHPDIGQNFGFFPYSPSLAFTKTLIYLTLLNNSAFPEKANKGDRPTGRFGAVPSLLQGQWKQTLPFMLQPRIYRRKEICPQFPPTYLPF